MHFVGPDQLHGFEERLTTDIYPADFAWTPDWERSDERIAKWYHNMDALAEAGEALATYQIDYDEEVGCVLGPQALRPGPRPGRSPVLPLRFVHSSPRSRTSPGRNGGTSTTTTRSTCLTLSISKRSIRTHAVSGPRSRPTRLVSPRSRPGLLATATTPTSATSTTGSAASWPPSARRVSSTTPS